MFSYIIHVNMRAYMHTYIYMCTYIHTKKTFHCIVLHYNIFHYITMHFPTLHYTTLHDIPPPPPVALQSLKDPGRLTYTRFLKPFRLTVGLLGRVISPSQGLYLHKTTQHRKTRTNIHALGWIRTHDPSNQPAKTHASDRMATVTGTLY
jgi:hypothetical protein